jgi:hypothetical protein
LTKLAANQHLFLFFASNPSYKLLFFNMDIDSGFSREFVNKIDSRAKLDLNSKFKKKLCALALNIHKKNFSLFESETVRYVEYGNSFRFDDDDFNEYDTLSELSDWLDKLTEGIWSVKHDIE